MSRTSGHVTARGARRTLGAMALISTAEAATRAGLSPAHIRDLMVRGVLKGRKFGNSWAVDDRSLDAYLKKERKPGPKPLAKRPRQRG